MFEHHLLPGDVIAKIGDCEVNDFQSWVQCLEYLMSPEYNAKGYCIKKSLLDKESNISTERL